MTWIAVAIAGTQLVGGLMSSDSQRSAGNQAADAQTAASQAGIAAQQKQFDAIQKMLEPFVTAGTGAVGKQQDLVGANGNQAQQSAIDAIKQSPAFTSQLQLGENRILANASATGGLRGGNIQAALGKFSPQLLSQLISDQYTRLGGLSTLGENAGALTGNAGVMTGQGIAGLLQQGGAAQAGGFLNAGRADQNLYNSFGSAIGTFAGLGGFGAPTGAGMVSGGSGFHF